MCAHITNPIHIFTIIDILVWYSLKVVWNGIYTVDVNALGIVSYWLLCGEICKSCIRYSYITHQTCHKEICCQVCSDLPLCWDRVKNWLLCMTTSNIMCVDSHSMNELFRNLLQECLSPLTNVNLARALSTS